MELCFVLVEPAVPENIGAAARAIKTMGFHHLRIVNSQRHHEKMARVLAHGAGDILDGVDEFASLAEALADIDLAIATSAKRRLGKRHNYPPDQLRQLISGKGQAVARVAMVFGREESGLSNDELLCCDMLTSVPIAQSYPSLNLGQAVMVYAYALSQIDSEVQTPVASDTSGQWQALKHRLEVLMEDVGFDRSEKLFHWAQERLSVIAEKDVAFLHRLLAAIEQKIKRGDDSR